MIDVTLSDFNTYIREFGVRTFLVAGRIFDLAPDKWEFLACAWYEKNGLLELPNDRYIGKHQKEDRDIVRYHSVDSLLRNPPTELVGMGLHIYEGWVAKKAENEKNRKADPVVIISKPNPEPPPIPKPDRDDSAYDPHPNMPKKPKPVDLPPKSGEPAVKKNPPAWLVRFDVWFGILSGAAGLFAWFFPAIKPWLMGIVPLIEAILKAWGV